MSIAEELELSGSSAIFVFIGLCLRNHRVKYYFIVLLFHPIIISGKVMVDLRK